MKSPTTIIFLTTLLLALLTHNILWRSINFIDQDRWIMRTQNLAHDFTDSQWSVVIEHPNGQARYSAHPGTTIIFPAALLTLTGIPAATALRGTIIVIISLLIAGIFTIAYVLRPQSYWWLAAGSVALFFPLYFYATPTNVLIAPCLTLIALIALGIYERTLPANHKLIILLGLLIGLAADIRLHDAAVLSAMFLVIIEPVIKRRQLLIVLGLATLTTIALNPLLWFSPLQYAENTVLRIATHVAISSPYRMVITPEKFILYTPITVLALLATAFGLITILFKPNRPLANKILPTSPQFLLAFLVGTVGISTIFFIARYQTLRYFYPFIMIWDILFALIILNWAKSTRFPKEMPTIVLIIFVSSYLLLFLYNVYPPTLQGYI